MSRTPSVDPAVVAARLQAGETRAEIAQRLGTSYANVVAAARRWQRLSGRSLPRARRGKIGPIEGKHVTPRMQAVVTAYRPEGVTLRQVGAQFGKSAENSVLELMGSWCWSSLCSKRQFPSQPQTTENSSSHGGPTLSRLTLAATVDTSASHQ